MTLSNWRRSGQSDFSQRLQKRANKRASGKHILPEEYIESGELLESAHGYVNEGYAIEEILYAVAL